ncbi:IS110 family transposase [Helcococcus ovis]|uniref:Transposase n=2 Tax=Peptoniphilus indolicus TaxID=33030 RepID=G4D705_9FIRM|nr:MULTISPECIES: IS110 family transposase [Peptoniphilaceae]EGY76317.1 transposase [Peptoniphilus indolicus ATCC 29427]TFF63748.1 IS110 family transposase [Helcococcus ovis]SUB74485.1 Transposase IS116/IS110/IS902 family [Peptoniphilus indolicus]SUB74553.1 Transposase IS116/IS110/IS902 family [Peptoniphilus indolicus]SUB74642.1 Transposase IS116/IS110/IS902 family [Peptoniphilus indolicus]
MISIGIDIAKEKFTACALEQGSKIIWKPFDVNLNKPEVEGFLNKLKDLNQEIKIVMEATGKYHLPILYELKKQGYFVAVINPLKMKQFCRVLNFRKAKNDNIDATQIAEYGLMYWKELQEHKVDTENFRTLKELNRSYQHYMDLRINQMNFIDQTISQTFPGIKKLISHGSKDFSKDKLLDFLETWWHKDLVLEKTEEKFIEDFKNWAKEKRYHPNADKAKSIYKLAEESISTQPSNSSYIKMNLQEGIELIKHINQILYNILSQMIEIAEPLEEYQEAKKFSGISDKLAVQITAEFGDLSKFKNKKCLISFVGIDSPPYESGNFKADQRKITKRGNAILRKIGYQSMKCMMSVKNPENEIYLYMLKKEKDGKAKKVCKFAGLNKFLRIYYAKVMASKQEKEALKVA